MNFDAEVDQALKDGRIPPEVSADYLKQNRDRPAIVVIYFVGALTTFIVLLRCYGRALVVQKFGLDDGLALLGLFIYLAFIGLSIRLVGLGSGMHMQYIQFVMDLETTKDTEVLDFIGHIIYVAQLYICRISGLAFYHRLCERHKSLIKFIKFCGAFITCAFLPQLFLIIFHCIPVTAEWPYSWQAENQHYECLAWGVVYTTNSALSLACDIVIFMIPAALIYFLKANRTRKIQLAMVLFPGVLVIIISTVRLYLVVRGGWDEDGSWSYSPQLAVQNAEVGGVLIALSIPGLKPLLGKVFGKVSSHFKNSSSNPRSTRRSATLGSSQSRKTADLALHDRPGEVQYDRSTAKVWSSRSKALPRTESDVSLLENGAHAKGGDVGIVRTTAITIEAKSIPMQPLHPRT